MSILSAPYELTYTYRRSTGPIIGRFLTSLRDGHIEGVRCADGHVVVPAVEYDPRDGAALDEFVAVGDAGTVQTWCWVGEPREEHPLDAPFAWALIKLDGADTAMLHAVAAPGPEAMSSGMRVRARWAEERVGFITDIACFEPVEAA